MADATAIASTRTSHTLISASRNAFCISLVSSGSPFSIASRTPGSVFTPWPVEKPLFGLEQSIAQLRQID